MYGWLGRIRGVVGLCRQMRNLETIASPEVNLGYSPDVAEGLDLDAHLRLWRRVVAEQTDRFGFSLGRPVDVVLLPTMVQLRRVKGRNLGAGGMTRSGPIWAAPSLLRSEDAALQFVRHETTHVFAARWGSLAPLLKAEGLAMWVGGPRVG
ncbi:MAG: hypothetical protein HY321_16800 [Armatimonadetes bacterium]|nr:hypothetical protein [Armatimonadota bacterium]